MSKCVCPMCTRSAEFKKHLDTINDPEAKKFFEAMYSNLFGIEEDLEVVTIYLKNLKTLYPKVYREISTIRLLKPEESKYPESFL